VVTAEDGAAWLAFVRGLVARGLPGAKLVSSDAHPGLVDAIAATLPGAAWQRCRTHFMRNLLTRVPKSAQSFVATMVRTIFAQPDAATVREQHARIVDQLQTRFAEARRARKLCPRGRNPCVAANKSASRARKSPISHRAPPFCTPELEVTPSLNERESRAPRRPLLLMLA
jgi:hypothetical protein